MVICGGVFFFYYLFSVFLLQLDKNISYEHMLAQYLQHNNKCTHQDD